MNKDVQRTFVLLRQLAGGRQSGYARAETKDGRVKLNLVVQGFEKADVPYAFAVTEDGLLLIGQLNMDQRGQGGISAEISSKDLKQMQMLFVAFMDDGKVNIPLAGTVGRGGWVDWTQVAGMVEEALRPESQQPQPRADSEEMMPDDDEPDDYEEMPIQEQPNPPQAAQECPAREDEDGEKQEESVPMPMQEPDAEPMPMENLQDEPAAPLEPKEEQPAPQDHTDEGDLFDVPAQEDPFAAVERSLRRPLPREQCYEIPEKLRCAYWPQVLWPLHDLFERFPQVNPFPEQKDVVYIRVPLGDAYREMDHYLVGAKIDGDWVVGVGYLIPGNYSQKAPSWMTGYEWKDGYWQAWQFMESAE